MILIKLVKNKNKTIKEAYGKYYARPVVTETIGIDELAEHMASHNTPFSKGAIKGLLTDMVSCVKELVLQNKAVKIDNLAIFSIGIINKMGSRQHQGVEPRQVCRRLPSQSTCYRQAQQHTALSRCQRQERHGSPQL